MVEEKTLEAAEADLFPPTAADDSRESFSDAKPFASKDAPWVGAEDKWLEGAPDLPPPPVGSSEDAKKPFSVIPDEDDDDLALHQSLPAGHSLAPLPPKNAAFNAKIAIAIVVLVLAAAGAVIYWMNTRFAEREREMAERERQMMAQRAADKEDVIRLERLIAELSAQGGAENAQRVSALQVELKAKQEAVAAAEAAQASGATLEQAAGSQEGARRKEDEKSAAAEKTLTSAASGKIETSSKPTAAEIADNPYATNGNSAEEPRPAQKSGDDDLLDRALSGSYSSMDRAKKDPGIPLGGTTLPESPSRAQVKTAMDAVAPQVQKCGPGSGRVVLSVTVAGPTGRVLNAEPSGDAVGTPQGLCAARAVKLAKFPPFQQARPNIKYPFDL